MLTIPIDLSQCGQFCAHIVLRNMISEFDFVEPVSKYESSTALTLKKSIRNGALSCIYLSYMLGSRAQNARILSCV